MAPGPSQGLFHALPPLVIESIDSNSCTFQGDLNYDGRIGMKDLVALDAGIRNSSGSIAHDVDANYDGKLNMEDLSIIDADWGRAASSLHLSHGDKQFLGSDQISMAELLSQGDRRWNTSNFVYQNSLERDELMGEH